MQRYERREFREKHLEIVVQAAKALYQASEKPIRILDLATGPNEFNPRLLKRFREEGIDYELVLQDISPTWLKVGYENLERVLEPKELGKVKCVLADGRDLRKDLDRIELYDRDGKNKFRHLDQVLDDLEYVFLRKSGGYEENKRTVSFEDETFDLVIGCVPYSSIAGGAYEDAVRESVRVLKGTRHDEHKPQKGGYHIVWDTQTEEINYDAERTDEALAKARIPIADNVRRMLNCLLIPIRSFYTSYTWKQDESRPDQAVQLGDKVRDVVLVHKK